MGTGTFVNQPLQRSISRRFRAVRTGIDFILVGVVIALVLFGLLMVYSAGPLFAALLKQNADFFLIRQSMWALLGFVGAGVLMFLDYHFYKRFTLLIMGGTIALLLAVIVIGDMTFGATRSLNEGSIRPSEFAKLATILYVAVWLNAKKDVLNDITFGLIPLILILGVVGALIMLQPDFSAAFTIVVLGAMLFFLAGGEWRQIALVLVITLFLGWVIVNLYPTGKDRVLGFWSGLQEPIKAEYQVRRSLEAIIRGGVFGVGIGNSTTKLTGLPVAHNDSIFAVIAEETGLVGAFLLIGAYVVFLWRGLAIAKNAPDELGSLLAGGITIWIVLEAMLNIGVSVNLLPQAGNALPFISYGGSSLLSTLAGVGILLNIGRLGNQQKQKGEQTLGAVVNLRWRDGRRRVSRPVHPASPEE